MSVLEQVQYETRVRKRYAAVTFAAAVLIVLSQLIQLSGKKADVSELTLQLVVANLRAANDISAAVLEALGYIALGFTLNWMYRISRARNPAMKPVVRYMAIAGIALSSVMAIAYTVIIAIKAHQFVTQGNQSYPEAHALTSSTGLELLPLLAELGSLLLAVGFVLTALNTMRVGLLTRWLGYTGVIAGALIIFPIGGVVPVIQGLWLAAVAVMMYGRWPNGDPPAWESGVSVPWQPMQSNSSASNQPRREPRPRQQRRRMGQMPTIVEPDQSKAPESDAAQTNGNGSAARAPQKRKRKRRS